MLFRRTLLLALTLTLALIAPVYAQEATPSEPAQTSSAATSAPLIFFGRGGLYLMDETTRKVTEWNQCGDSHGFRISPTGEWLARPDNEDWERLERPDNADGLRLCNLKTHTIVDVAAPGLSTDVAHTSIPAWSPDGNQVAWSVGFKDGNHQLYVYDLPTGKASILVDHLPPLDTMAPQVIWGKSGILVVVDSQDNSKRIAPLYAPDGKLLMPDLSDNQYFVTYFWVTNKTGTEYLGRAMAYGGGNSVMVNPTNGEVFGVAGIELYSLLAPDGLGIEISFVPPGSTINRPNQDPLPIDNLDTALRGLVPFPQFDPTSLAIAPDGHAVAFCFPGHFIWREGKKTPIPDSIPSGDGDGVIWGPMGNRFIHEDQVG